MPTYTPVNPQMVAWDPQAITGGIAQAIQLADAYEQASERRDTQAMRIAAQNAANRKMVELATPETKAALARLGFETSSYGAKMPYVPIMAEAEGAGAESILRKAEIEKAIQPFRMKTASVQAESESELAPDIANLQGVELQNRLFNAQSDLELANGKFELAQKQLKDAIDNFEQGKATERDIADLAVQLRRAEVDKVKSETLYNTMIRGRGRSAQDTEAEISRLRSQAAALLRQPVPDPNADPSATGAGTMMPLSRYMDVTRDPETGQLRFEMSPGWLGLGFGSEKRTAKTSQAAEQMRDQYINTLRRLNELEDVRAGIRPGQQEPLAIESTSGGGLIIDTPQQLVDAVRNGLPAEQAKKIMAQKGWK